MPEEQTGTEQPTNPATSPEVETEARSEVPGNTILKDALTLEVANYRRQVIGLQAQVFEVQHERTRVEKTIELLEQQIRATVVRAETTERIIGML